jgi:hypothetical protein
MFGLFGGSKTTKPHKGCPKCHDTFKYTLHCKIYDGKPNVLLVTDLNPLGRYYSTSNDVVFANTMTREELVGKYGEPVTDELFLDNKWTCDTHKFIDEVREFSDNFTKPYVYIENNGHPMRRKLTYNCTFDAGGTLAIECDKLIYSAIHNGKAIVFVPIANNYNQLERLASNDPDLNELFFIKVPRDDILVHQKQMFDKLKASQSQSTGITVKDEYPNLESYLANNYVNITIEFNPSDLLSRYMIFSDQCHDNIVRRKIQCGCNSVRQFTFDCKCRDVVNSNGSPPQYSEKC